MINSRLVIRLMSLAHAFAYRVTGGRLGGSVGKAPVLVLTTIGRRSGSPRSTPVLYLRDGERLVLVASNAGDDKDPLWWSNLRENPRATVRVGATNKTVSARQASPDEKLRYWPQLVSLYPAYSSYQKKTRREIPLVVLTPIE
jgi:deazaflavin-dependent oxidoreductase (nitroreductase family)